MNQTSASPAQLGHPRARPSVARSASPIAEAASEVHAGVTRLLETLGRADGGSDAFVAACMACLEAARSVSSVGMGEQDQEYGAQEALRATDAAKLAIRFALAESRGKPRTWSP